MINNNKLVETKKELTLWERVSPNETCMRVREECVWTFCEARLVVEDVMTLSRHSRTSVQTSATAAFWGVRGVEL
jgi:hypothetical protein